MWWVKFRSRILGFSRARREEAMGVGGCWRGVGVLAGARARGGEGRGGVGGGSVLGPEEGGLVVGFWRVGFMAMGHEGWLVES